MDKIQTGIPIANLQPFTPPTPLMTDFSDRFPDMRRPLVRETSAEARLSQWHEQVNTSQHTVFEVNNKVIATFGDNGFSFFASGGDGGEPGASHSEKEQALIEKYGSALKIHHYPAGKGPTEADIFERMHGYRPQPPIDLRA